MTTLNIVVASDPDTGMGSCTAAVVRFTASEVRSMGWSIQVGPRMPTFMTCTSMIILRWRGQGVRSCSIHCSCRKSKDGSQRKQTYSDARSTTNLTIQTIVLMWMRLMGTYIWPVMGISEENNICVSKDWYHT